METWASTSAYATAVQFLCVCVESAQVAQAFAHWFEFQGVVNGYIPSRSYMPVGYGQLGCSGFIVVNAKGHFVSRKTLSFLDYGPERAFADVERLLNQELGWSDKNNNKNDKKNKNDKTVSVAAVMAQQQATTVVEPPPLVGIVSMDAEHAHCTAAMNTLLVEPTEEHLEVVLQVVKNHFDHEERLLQEYGFGGSIHDEFSPLVSHKKDHARILAIGQEALVQCNTTTATPSSCTSASVA